MIFAMDIARFTNAFLNILRDKKKDTIKCIDGVLETAMNLECTNIDGDITFDNCSNYFIYDFESTVNTICKIMLLTGLDDMLADDDDLSMEITYDRDLIKFLSEHTNNIKEYHDSRDEVSKWIKD